jgi:hypothetical protein
MFIFQIGGLHATKKMVPLLKQASCYGNLDAMYMLSVILSKGVGYKANEIQVWIERSSSLGKDTMIRQSSTLAKKCGRLLNLTSFGTNLKKHC